MPSLQARAPSLHPRASGLHPMSTCLRPRVPSLQPNPTCPACNPTLRAQVAEIYRSILTLSCIAPIHKCSVSAEAADLVSRLLVLQPHHRYA